MPRALRNAVIAAALLPAVIAVADDVEQLEPGAFAD
jgi:hypothetical protein